MVSSDSFLVDEEGERENLRECWYRDSYMDNISFENQELKYQCIYFI